SRYQRRTLGRTSASFSKTLIWPSSVSSALVPPKKVLAVTSSRNELETSARSPISPLLASSQSAVQLSGASLYTSVLVTSVMYQATAPMPATRPSGYLLTNETSRLPDLIIMPVSIGVHSSVD